MLNFILNWLDRRFGIKKPHGEFLTRITPDRLSFPYCFGGMAFTAFLISAATGLMLSLYYVPSGKEALGSIAQINKRVWLGWLVRGVHKWSASILIVLITLHAMRVFISKAYRPPRELNWMAGSLTLFITLASGFTGYLLPWDQKAYWATTVGTSMAGTVPYAGGALVKLLRGGRSVSGATLTRFYSMHTLWLPFMMALVLWAHFHMIKKQGLRGAGPNGTSPNGSGNAAGGNGAL
ncbi:MAG: cytochrome b N-terminal domain-containing protein [Nitrospiraceae bacterium]|nr:cytochrome b N-terminal domain-containing protein [Nitrospiraceae bacterium]